MSFDYDELEEILKSINEKKANEEEPKTENKPLPEPPKAHIEERKEDGVDISSFDVKKPIQRETEPEQETPEETESKGVKLSFTPPEFVLNIFEKAKAFGFKKIGIILCVIVVIIVGIIAADKISDYAKTAYIKDYEKQYGIDFPDGILKEMCDEYGKDQSFAGTVTIKDANVDNVKVYSTSQSACALLEKGSDVKKSQHIRAISLDNCSADLESVYSNADDFVYSSQKVEFATLFEKEEYQVVAAYYTNTKPEDDNGYVFPYNAYGNLTKSSFYQYKDRIKTRQLYNTGYKLLEQNYILSVSVPSDFMPDFRFVLVCVKAEDNFNKIESAEPNEKIYYPQVWYDKNKQKNPYYLTGKWYPEIIIDSSGKTKQLTAEDFQ